MKRFLDFILFGNIYIALGAVCMIQSTVMQLHLSDPLYFYSIFVFFATLFIYNFQRIFYQKTEDKSYNSIRRKWIFENQMTIKLLTVAGLAGMSVFFFFNRPVILIYLSPLFILSLAYFMPGVKLRKNAWFKLITLAGVWVITTAAVPLLLTNAAVDVNFSIHILARYCFMIGICIPFDIRDMAIDAAEKVSTLANTYGEKLTRNIALLFILLFGGIAYSEYYLAAVSFSVFTALLLSTASTFFFIVFCSSRRSEYYYVAGLDGTMILQVLFLILFSAAH